MAVSPLDLGVGPGAVPIYPVVGDGGRALLHRLRAMPELRVVRSPRHASLLVVAGDLTDELEGPAGTVHDQVSPPRAVVQWGLGEESRAICADAVLVGAEDDPRPAIVEAHRALASGSRASSSPVGRASNPVDWRGRGPHGQGGEGMMGGTPYGRPMAMTGPDLRDGLELDRVALTVGPFLSWLPAGLTLELELQGDVVQRLTPRVVPLRRADLPAVFLRARRESVSVADLEVARARHLLLGVSDFLRVLGLGALADRTLRVASAVDGPARLEAVRELRRRLRRTRAPSLAARGVGALPRERLHGAGPVARAAGLAEDARLDDPAYAGLGFRVITQSRGDADARWLQRLDEAVQALELAAAAEERLRAPNATLEGPRGRTEARPAALQLAALAEHAPGCPWDELVMTIASLDLDVAGVPSRIETSERTELGPARGGARGDQGAAS